jgi:hypothetical protein
MINRAIFSYFNPDEDFGNRSGFMKYSDFLFTTALSVLCASRLFKEVQIISSSWGVDMLSQFNLPVTSYSDRLNEMKDVSPYFWAYGKLIAYCEQTTPFIHIDNDVFIWKPLPERILNARLCFQSHEPFDKAGYKYYNMLKPCFNMAPVKPTAIKKNPVTDFAYNCGICGGFDLDHFREWRENSAEYIFAERNQPIFFGKYKNILIHQNLFHEQYFNACLIKEKGLRDEVEVLHEDALHINDGYPKDKPLYTHLWGTTKTDAGRMARVRMTLLDQDIDLFMRIHEFCKKNNI